MKPLQRANYIFLQGTAVKQVNIPNMVGVPSKLSVELLVGEVYVDKVLYNIPTYTRGVCHTWQVSDV